MVCLTRSGRTRTRRDGFACMHCARRGTMRARQRQTSTVSGAYPPTYWTGPDQARCTVRALPDTPASAVTTCMYCTRQRTETLAGHAWARVWVALSRICGDWGWHVRSVRVATVFGPAGMENRIQYAARLFVSVPLRGKKHQLQLTPRSRSPTDPDRCKVAHFSLHFAMGKVICVHGVVEYVSCT
jgi:hypothetical protein